MPLKFSEYKPGASAPGRAPRTTRKENKGAAENPKQRTWNDAELQRLLQTSGNLTQLNALALEIGVDLEAARTKYRRVSKTKGDTETSPHRNGNGSSTGPLSGPRAGFFSPGARSKRNATSSNASPTEGVLPPPRFESANSSGLSTTEAVSHASQTPTTARSGPSRTAGEQQTGEPSGGDETWSHSTSALLSTAAETSTLHDDEEVSTISTSESFRTAQVGPVDNEGVPHDHQTAAPSTLQSTRQANMPAPSITPSPAIGRQTRSQTQATHASEPVVVPDSNSSAGSTIEGGQAPFNTVNNVQQTQTPRVNTLRRRPPPMIIPPRATFIPLSTQQRLNSGSLPGNPMDDPTTAVNVIYTELGSRVNGLVSDYLVMVGQIGVYNQELETIKTTHRQESDAAKATHGQELAELTGKHSQEFKTMKDMHSQESNATKATHEQELVELTGKHSQELETMKEEHVQVLGTAKERYEHDLRMIKEAHNLEHQTLNRTHSQEVDTNAATHDQEIQNLNGQLKNLNKFIQWNDIKLAGQLKRIRDLEIAVQRGEGKTNEINQQMESSIAEAKAAKEHLQNEHYKEMAAAKEEMSAAKGEIAAAKEEVAAAEEKHKAQGEEIRNEHAKLSQEHDDQIQRISKDHAFKLDSQRKAAATTLATTKASVHKRVRGIIKRDQEEQALGSKRKLDADEQDLAQKRKKQYDARQVAHKALLDFSAPL